MSLKQKNIALIVGFVSLLGLTYQFSIDNTLEIKRKYNTLLAQKELLSNVPQQISYLKQQNVYYDSILEKNKIAIESSFQNNLLSHINSFVTDGKIQVISFIEPHTYSSENAVIKTFSFTIKGNYKNILQLINTVEKLGTYGKIISIKFEKKKNYKISRKSLECKIFLQKIIPKKE